MALKVSSAGAREESSLQRYEDGEAEISDGVGDVTERSSGERGRQGEGTLRQTEEVVQSFQDGENWSSRMVTPETSFVLVRGIVFCPLAGWGGEMPTREGWPDGETPAARDGPGVVPVA